MAQKFYVLWAGRQTGIFTDWATTQRAVEKFAGARFKSFPARAEAQQAFALCFVSAKVRAFIAVAVGMLNEQKRQLEVHRWILSGSGHPDPGHL